VTIEICCHTTDKDVQEHFERTEETYMKLLQCHEGYVINFTTQSYVPGRYVWPSPQSEVKVIHVYHNLEWSDASMTVLKDGKEVSTSISLTPL